MNKANWCKWVAGFALAALLVYVPFQYYRYVWEHAKRLRPIEEGRVYRSGCLSADGFRDALKKNHIKTVISFWDEDPDPTLYANRFDHSTPIKESDLCRSMGVNYRFIYAQLLPDARAGIDRPAAIDEFLKIMDDESNYPVLIHCKAGLHRTGIMAAIYRMEYDGWSREEAMHELRSHGFGFFLANTANPYIEQYVMPYKPRAVRGP